MCVIQTAVSEVSSVEITSSAKGIGDTIVSVNANVLNDRFLCLFDNRFFRQCWLFEDFLFRCFKWSLASEFPFLPGDVLLEERPALVACLPFIASATFLYGFFCAVSVWTLVASARRELRVPLCWVSLWPTLGAANGIVVSSHAGFIAFVTLAESPFTAPTHAELVLDWAILGELRCLGGSKRG